MQCETDEKEKTSHLELEVMFKSQLYLLLATLFINVISVSSSVKWEQ